MIAVTGATGQLGRLVIEQLRAKHPSEKVVAVVRSPEKAKDLGVEVRLGDYDKPETLAGAFAGVDSLLLISGSEVGKRIPQHRAAIDAAKKAGVKRIVYTSAPKATVSAMKLAAEHKATEEALVASGVPYVVLRNNWYIENYFRTLGQTVAQGAMHGAAGEGRIAGASRADFAAAAVAVLTGGGHDGKTYELGGAPFTLADMAAAIGKWAGKNVGYVNHGEAEYRELLVKLGLPAMYADVLADTDAQIAKGALEGSGADMTKLIGRAPETVEQVLARQPRV